MRSSELALLLVTALFYCAELASSASLALKSAANKNGSSNDDSNGGYRRAQPSSEYVTANDEMPTLADAIELFKALHRDQEREGLLRNTIDTNNYLQSVPSDNNAPLFRTAEEEQPMISQQYEQMLLRRRPLLPTQPQQRAEKRAQTFVRFGKRSQTFVRFGKRGQTFVRFG